MWKSKGSVTILENGSKNVEQKFFSLQQASKTENYLSTSSTTNFCSSNCRSETSLSADNRL